MVFTTHAVKLLCRRGTVETRVQFPEGKRVLGWFGGVFGFGVFFGVFWGVFVLVGVFGWGAFGGVFVGGVFGTWGALGVFLWLQHAYSSCEDPLFSHSLVYRGVRAPSPKRCKKGMFRVARAV